MDKLILHNKREIAFDLYSFTFDEYSKIFGEGGEERAAELIARSVGMSAEEYNALPYPDNRKIYARFFKLCRDVMSDPNSESAPT